MVPYFPPNISERIALAIATAGIAEEHKIPLCRPVLPISWEKHAAINRLGAAVDKVRR